MLLPLGTVALTPGAVHPDQGSVRVIGIDGQSSLPMASVLSCRRNMEGEMPYANSAGIQIHYEVEGTGPALVLQHGFTQCLEDWFECGYVAALRSRYRLILVDARGHGDSDKPHDEESCTLDHRVADVTTVLDVLGIERAHFWGYSMGGYIGFGMSKYAPHRVNRESIRVLRNFAQAMYYALRVDDAPWPRRPPLPNRGAKSKRVR
jgi:pimeloyl-ACP methyl ester carboxylesterase